ncbi:hypothetical protein R9D66_004248 [Citrobacter amalonaticus]|nr:hypothetical protein [Citrobacter amalonaticus]
MTNKTKRTADFLAKSYITMDLDKKGISVLEFTGNMPCKLKEAFLLSIKNYQDYRCKKDNTKQ